MQITENSVVAIEYTLKGDDGQVIDTSEGREPLVYLHGHSNIIPGLEKAIEGKAPGDELEVTVPPEDGYGQYRKELVQDVPKDAFAGMDKVEPGMSFRAESNAGPMTVIVREIKDDAITIDGNHMLAGQVLNFKVAVKSVREATAEEISEGVAQAA